jgi:hypothetical protein
MPRSKPCTKEMKRGRLRKAEQFIDAARTVEALANEGDDVADAFVTLLVHAGVAAADVVCCAVLAEHAQGENHIDAVGLLHRADPSLSVHLRTLLGMKTDAGYSHLPISATDRKRAWRAASTLAEAARTV